MTVTSTFGSPGSLPPPLPPDAGPPADAAASAPAAGAALVLALRETLDKIAAAAADPDPEEMVHDARKAMKEYRALLRLMDGADAVAARRATAAAARGLASARDRAAAREALDFLAEAGLLLPVDRAAALAVIGEDEAAPAEADTLRAALGVFLDDARARLAQGLEVQAAACHLTAGLRRGYRAARGGSFADAGEMHALRKRVVTHRYQMSFIAAYCGGRGDKRAQRAQRLRDLLGAHQDIEILRPMLHGAADTLGEGTLSRLDIAMRRLQKQVRGKARKLHAALFRRPSHAFAHRLRHLAPPVA